jgi:hypothetical protein
MTLAALATVVYVGCFLYLWLYCGKLSSDFDAKLERFDALFPEYQMPDTLAPWLTARC